MESNDNSTTLIISQCEKCGHKVPFTENLLGRYCPDCGYKHPTLDQYRERAQQPRCRFCAAANQSGKFCMDCGREIGRAQKKKG